MRGLWADGFQGLPADAYSYSYSYDPFMPCPDEDSAYLTCLNAAAQNGVGAPAGLMGLLRAVAGGSLCKSEFQDAAAIRPRSARRNGRPTSSACTRKSST